jgi:hypothetical protein
VAAVWKLNKSPNKSSHLRSQEMMVPVLRLTRAAAMRALVAGAEAETELVETGAGSAVMTGAALADPGAGHGSEPGGVLAAAAAMSGGEIIAEVTAARGVRIITRALVVHAEMMTGGAMRLSVVGRGAAQRSTRSGRSQVSLKSGPKTLCSRRNLWKIFQREARAREVVKEKARATASASRKQTN